MSRIFMRNIETEFNRRELHHQLFTGWQHAGDGD